MLIGGELDQQPQASSLATTSLILDGETIRFIYSRSKAALEAGMIFDVEYHDSLNATPWTSIGAGTVVADGPQQSIEALIPVIPSQRRFVRLRVTAP